MLAVDCVSSRASYTNLFSATLLHFVVLWIQLWEEKKWAKKFYLFFLSLSFSLLNIRIASALKKAIIITLIKVFFSLIVCALCKSSLTWKVHLPRCCTFSRFFFQKFFSFRITQLRFLMLKYLYTFFFSSLKFQEGCGWLRFFRV